MGNLKTYNIPAHAYYITTKVAQGVQLFIDNTYCGIIINNFKFYKQTKQCKLLGYVIMPTHLNYIFWPVGTFSISEVLRDFKKQAAKGIIQQLKDDKRSDRIQNPICGNCGSGITNPASRTWAQKGLSVFFRNSVKQEFQVWQAQNWMVNICSEQLLHQKFDYIHNNPVRAGLVSNADDYKYSSARNYIQGDHSVIRIENF